MSDSDSIKLALISEGIGSWPLYVAQGRQLFEREGIRVETTLTRSSAKQLEDLKAGRYDIGFQQSDHVVRAVQEGSDLFAFMAIAHAPQLSLVVASGVRSFADLKHRTIAVDGARSGYALLLRKLLASHGVGESDYTFVEIGGSQERYDALRRGVAAASWLNSPFDRNLFADGFGTLGTTVEHFPTYPGPVAAARRSWAAAHSAELVSFIRAMQKGYAWLREPANCAAAVALLPSRLNVSEEDARRAYGKYAGSPPPVITLDGLRQVIDVVWEAAGYAPPRGEPERYVDLSYWRRATG